MTTADSPHYQENARPKRCRHPWDKWLWEDVGPAPDFRGEPCRLWRCRSCGKERELFAGVQPGWAEKKTDES